MIFVIPVQYYDQETGKHYNYFRDYDPSTGRYIQSDPIGLGGGLNTYGYVGANPLSYSDTKGLCPMCVLAIPALTGTDLAIIGGVLCLGVGCGESVGQALSDFVNQYNEDASDAESGQCPTPDNPSWPGDDPKIAPPGTKWIGAPGSIPGDGKGNYHNPDTDESYRPDLEHPDPIGPHWDYHGPSGEKGRFLPDGTYHPK